MGLEKSYNQFIYTIKLKIYKPCNLKLWFMYFFTIIFPIMQKKYYKKLNVILNSCIIKRNKYILNKTS